MQGLLWRWRPKSWQPGERPSSPCKPAKGRTTKDGYCQRMRNGRRRYAHRWAMAVALGIDVDSPKMPELVMHLCDNRRCANPDHLAPGTTVSNHKDKMAKERYQKGGEIHTARLNEQQVCEIRRLHSEGRFNQKQLACLYGVSPSSVNRIVLRRSWKHLPC
ncbi:MAG: hypothetical protein F4177_04990 [Chloroflexi bacterium]|nr:hypothetical protein [Chloroflexota bacterium]